MTTTGPALATSARIALEECMALKAGESLLVVTDDALLPIGQALLEAGRALGAAAHLLQEPLGRVSGAEPDPLVAAAMAAASAVICPTAASLTHTRARREACAAGGRVATMPGITPEIMARAMRADVSGIAERTRRVAAWLEGRKQVEISTSLGTRLSLSMAGRRVIASEGLVREPGSFGNLPSGEVYLAPVEGSAEGTLVVDGAFAGIGMLAAPITIEVRAGLAVSFGGGEQARALERLLRAHGDKGLNVAELGIGTNDAARISGHILEDEKVLGTIHIAFGNNLSMGGSVDAGIHLDGIVNGPTLRVDGEPLLEEGRLLLDR